MHTLIGRIIVSACYFARNEDLIKSIKIEINKLTLTPFALFILFIRDGKITNLIFIRILDN